MNRLLSLLNEEQQEEIHNLDERLGPQGQVNYYVPEATFPQLAIIDSHCHLFHIMRDFKLPTLEAVADRLKDADPQLALPLILGVINNCVFKECRNALDMLYCCGRLDTNQVHTPLVSTHDGVRV